jgi:hypothetical protein
VRKIAAETLLRSRGTSGTSGTLSKSSETDSLDSISPPDRYLLAFAPIDSPASLLAPPVDLLLAIRAQPISVLVGQRRIGGAYACGGGYG